MNSLVGKPGSRSILLASLLCLVTLLFTSAGCAQKADDATTTAALHDIEFNTIGQGAFSQYGRVDEGEILNDAAPECLVITDGEEYQRLQSLASFNEQLPTVDFSSKIVIAAMQGPKNTGGYAISIMHVSQDGSDVRVELDIVEPEAGSITVPTLTSPYHLVAADRSAFDPRGQLTFSFFDQHDARLSQEPAQI
jgi:PrcB C-terminal